MTVSLRNQTVYAPSVTGVKPVTMMMFACMCLLMVLANKIWIKASLVDLGYSLAAEKKVGTTLTKEKSELKMLKNLMIQQVSLSNKAEGLNLSQVTADQIIKIN